MNLRKISILVSSVTTCLLGAQLIALAGGNVNFLIANRSLDNDRWDPVSPQPAFGVAVDISPGGGPIAIAFGAQFSAREERDDAYAIGEVSVGALWKPRVGGSAYPYLGAGIAHVAAAVDLDFEDDDIDTDDDDSSIGWYLNGGVSWRLGERLNLGLDARLMRGTEGELLGIEGDADYLQVGVLIGFGWGD
jgi:opacity protein-like surface antigen